MAKATKKTETTQATITEKIRKAADTLTEKVKEYNEKYVAANIEKGKETLKEYNEKYLEKTIEKGKDTFREYNDKYVSKYVEKGKSYVEGPYKKVSGQVDELLEKGREIEKDAVKKIEDVLEKGKKLAAKLPMADTIEKKVTAGLNAVPSLVNLPVKEDIQKLTKAMNTLNSNIETLKKKAA
ncbi:MAG: hypothetical protein GXP53_13775 [Deltaproteobacteria bacterium]|nr:hypothetical protein [Deltaproteobacteria bacterium]